MVTDVIADFIIRIKNAGMVRKEQISMPYSKMRNALAQKLRVSGYVGDVSSVGHGTDKRLVINLLYNQTTTSHKVSGMSRISKPGRRVYIGTRDIRPVKNSHGVLLLSTPKGILTGEEARKERVGGEVLFSLW